ncbi:hypothetical protein CPB83DRAFT_850221 [Crepidotus variabilis]|uniref:Uncharacterized protein n=1 Tax=Crepidotus variabilis TaxID=179855 RepID=A0A9P6ELE9_9AGAR|nr:hypothetical protein CPB83DRAFT_850221 [Crepidotus variabilis]
MSTWFDVFALVATIAVFGAVAYGAVYAINSINEGVNSTKENLKSKGYHVSSSGVSVKTQKRFNKEDEIDAAQRGIINVMSAASFRKGEEPVAPQMTKSLSNSSSKSGKGNSTEDKKKRKVFGSKS